MHYLGKFWLWLSLLSMALSMFLLSPCFAAGTKSSRIYPTNKVVIYSGEKMVGVYTREAPLPEGYTLATVGQCAVKMDEIYMVAEDQSSFSIDAGATHRNLFINKGTLYFRMPQMKRQINFITPAGSISAKSLILHSSSASNALMGYITVNNNQSELGVVDGGSMVVLTADGQMTVSTGEKIILAQAEMDIGPPEGDKTSGEETEPLAAQENEPKEPATDKSGTTKGTKIAVGVVGAGAAAGTLFALGGSSGGSGSGGNNSVSPSNIQ